MPECIRPVLRQFNGGYQSRATYQGSMLIGMQEIIAIWVYLYLHFLEANQRIIFLEKQRHCQR